MTDSSYTHYVLIIDRSGSMRPIAGDTQGGIREFAAEQDKLPGKHTLSLYQFDNYMETVTDFGKMSEVAGYVLRPRGMTALYGAIGVAVTETGEKLSAMSEADRPGKVIVVIATDGEENHSHVVEWAAQYADAQKIRDMITRQRDVYGWEFTYIGANQDSFAEAGKIGVPNRSIMDYRGSHAGTQSAWRGVTVSSRDYAKGASTSIGYSSGQRADSMKDDEEQK